MRRLIALVLATGALLSACGAASDADAGKLRVVASFYPLAWAAQQVGGGRVEVTDLTPPGGEAHDATLTASQRAMLEVADLIAIHGEYGFQPVIEEAAAGSGAPLIMLVDAEDPERTLVTSDGGTITDPHLWLSPYAMSSFVRALGRRLGEIDPQHRAEYEARAAAVAARFGRFEKGYDGCHYTEIVASHEAFAYLLRTFGNGVVTASQVGVEGVTPEGEPSADRVQAALEAIRSDGAPPVVFYEPSDEGRRIAEAVAADVGTEIAPLNPLESRPLSGDFLSELQKDYDTLAEWMECT